MSHRIDVVISDQTNKTSTNENGSVAVASANKTGVTETGKENSSSVKATTIATLVATRAFNYMTSNVGKWTGSQHTQNNVNKVMQVGAIGMTALINPWMALITSAIQIGTTSLDNWYEEKWDKKVSNQAKAKAGELKGLRH